MRENRAYAYWLHNAPGIGDRTIERLLEKFGSARAVYHTEEETLKTVVKKKAAERLKQFSREWEVEKKYEEMEQKGISFYSLEEEEYPAKLRKLPHPPYGIYCKGMLPNEETPSVAIIGARECSQYGRYVAEAFAEKMAAAGVAVVSGMARGIDGISQRAAIQGGGRTYGVLGCGVDICYPLSNRKLYQDIVDTGGGILSVFPPGTEPQKRQFPERNRIVAGLSDVLLVVEARTKSGTCITVDMALEQGKNVYAVPGRLTDRLSDGCNLLIRQGAGIALTPDDILEELKILVNRQGGEKGELPKDAAFNKRKEKGEDTELLRFLDCYPKSPDVILKEMEKSGKAPELPALLTRLMELCLEGKARQVAGNYFVKVCQSL